MTLFSKLKEIQELKKKAGELKNLLGDEKVEIDNDGIKIVINGNQKVLEIKINEELLKSESKEKLERLLQININEAIKKVQRLMAEKIKSSGFQMPNIN